MARVTVTARDRAGNTASAFADWTTSSTTDPAGESGYVPPDLTTVAPGTSLQSRLDATGRISLNPGTHVFTSPLLVNPGTVIYLQPGARLLKNFSAGGAQRNAGIQNRSWTRNGADDVFIGGPGEYSAGSESMRGNLISLMGDRIRLRDFSTKVWEGGRHTVLAGDDCRAHDMSWIGGGGSTGNGGLRFQGGRRFVGERLHCESGDDVFQFVPAGAEADPNYGMGIYDSVYRDCTGSSTHAKIVVIGLQFGGTAGAPDGEVTMPASSGVWRSGFVNVNAPDGTAVTCRIQNISGAGPIEDCYLDGVSTKGLPTTTGGVELLVNAHRLTGGISGLTLRGVRMLPIRQGVGMMRGGVDVVFEDCHFTRGTGATGDSVARIGGTRTTLRRCTFDGAGRSAAVVSVENPEPDAFGNGGPAPSQVLFDDCDFVNVNGTGVLLEAGTGTALQSCTWRGSGVAVKRTGGTAPTITAPDYGSLTPA